MGTKTIRTLLICFETEIPQGLISGFRGAIIEKVGREHVAFHNHTPTGFRYDYPLIQYKRVHSKASLYCMGSGVDEVHKFFGLRSWDIVLHGEKLTLTVDRLDLNSFELHVGERMYAYKIYNWLALNEENYRRYKSLGGLIEKTAFLERLLTGNILSFAKGIGWQINRPVRNQIQELKAEKMIRYKGVPMLAFDVRFLSNVFLPNHLGLGKSASHGFGAVNSIRKKD